MVKAFSRTQVSLPVTLRTVSPICLAQACPLTASEKNLYHLFCPKNLTNCSSLLLSLCVLCAPRVLPEGWCYKVTYLTTL